MLRCGPYSLDLSIPVVMGILNVTPDSFFDGGRYTLIDQAVEHALQMVQAGAGIIDVGGESTRPGARPVSEQEEIRRVIPVIEAILARLSVPISVDTSKAAVMCAAVKAGAAMINDVRALRESGALAAVAESSVAVCLMHMQGAPPDMQNHPRYTAIATEVREFLDARVAACEAAGIARERIVIDPGIGFGKQLQHNLELLAKLPALAVLQLPILVGVSRKSMFSTLLNRALEHRLAGALAATGAAVLGGASIIRTHDVAETLDAVKVAAALQAAGYCALKENHHP